MNQKTKPQGCCSYISSLCSMNPLNSSGALDVIVVQDEENNLRSSHFFLSVSKFKAFYPENREVEVFINGRQMELTMKLNHRGIGYFEYQIDKQEYLKSQRDLQSDEIDHTGDSL